MKIYWLLKQVGHIVTDGLIRYFNWFSELKKQSIFPIITCRWMVRSQIERGWPHAWKLSWAISRVDSSKSPTYWRLCLPPSSRTEIDEHKILWDFRFSRRRVWRWFSSVMLRRVVIVLLMEAVSTSETSVNIHETTQCNIPEDNHLHKLVCSQNVLNNSN
jgi:hypothetical protein